MAVKLPQFGSFLSALHQAGIKTGSARGSWGGVTPDDDIVVTTWTDAGKDNRFKIWRPKTRHGSLLDMWDLGRIEVGATVKVIMLRQRGTVPLDQPGVARNVHSAGLMPGRWRVVEVHDKHAFIEPVGA